MKKQLVFLLLLGGMLLSGAEINLIRAGATDYTLTMPKEASAMVKLAGRELQEYWRKSCGSELKCGLGNEPKQIILKTDPALASEEAMISTAGEHLILSGGDDWGILYAVYTFLENCFGIRWFSPYGDELVPQHRDLVFDGAVCRAKPRFAVRCLMPIYQYRHPAARRFFLRNRMNLGNELEHFVYYLNGHQSHTLFFYITPRKDYFNPFKWEWQERKSYFETNPEFFSMNYEGKRTDGMQLCFSNPGLRREFTRRFIERVEKTGKRGVYSISVMDYPGRLCCCPECRALEQKYSCKGGPLYDFLIELAKRIEKDYPEVMISTLAYHETEQPPKIPGKLPGNLVIVFAPLDMDFSKNMMHRNNIGSYRNLCAWTKIADQVWVWYYPLPYGGGLECNVERMASDTALMAKAGAPGTYYEHDVGVYTGLNFADLQTWMLLKLFQNPDQDYHSLVKEFCDFYYGQASSLMISYINELDAIGRESGRRTWNATTLKELGAEKNLVKWNKLFNQMEKTAAQDPDVLSRIRDVRLELDILTLRNSYLKLRRAYPEVFPAPEAVDKRVKDTLAKSMARRFPRSSELRNYWSKQALTDLSEALLYAACESPKPIPPPLDKVPPEKIRQVFPATYGYQSVSMVKDPDAALGFAIYDRDIEKKYPVFSCGFYDETSRTSLVHREIKRSSITPDQYRLYKIGSAPIKSANCFVWTTQWCARCDMGKLFTPGEPADKKYDIWISVKFEGPAYSSKSRARKSRALIDRVIVVEK